MVDHKGEGIEQLKEESGDETNELSPLTALSSVDGRYAEKTKPLRKYFSEFALIRGRIEIEIEYLIALAQEKVIRPLTEDEVKQLRSIYIGFTLADAKQVKSIEATTRHDVKSIEYFLKDKLKNTSLEDILSMVHFAVTSEDITNLAQNLALQRAKDSILVTSLARLIEALTNKAEEWRSVAILGRTHGREAAATTLGKEVALYADRLAKKLIRLRKNEFKFTGKLTGVVGNFHDHKAAVPEKDWHKFSRDFVKGLGLAPQPFTTQIEPHDRWAEFLHLIGEIMDLVETTDQNLWTYLSYDYLFLKPRKGQVGSSVMPHKGRNPIDLENSEGNTILASGMAKRMAEKLPQSRLQRHLSDSTIARNFGTLLGFVLLALENSASDISDFELKRDVIEAQLEHRWGIVTSGIQTRLRLLGVTDAYERFDALAKEGPITKERLHAYIDKFPVPTKEKNLFKSWTPQTYIGDAEILTDDMILEIRTTISMVLHSK